VSDSSTSDVALPVLLPVFNNGAVKVLEQLGRYRSPVWYSPLLASAAPIMVEHELQYTRETIDDGYLEPLSIRISWTPTYFHPCPPIFPSIPSPLLVCVNHSSTSPLRQHYSPLRTARSKTPHSSLSLPTGIPSRRHQSTCPAAVLDISFR